jgi:HSP20 family molecular chaperone IbpA
MAEEQALQVQDTEKRELDLAGAERTRDRLAFVPRADIYETNEGITVLADMPGVDESTVDITLENNVLTIRGYVDFVEPEGRSLALSEYRVGDYERAFSLSDQIDQDAIDALVKDGVLRLYLPKITEARKRTIAIRAG